MSRGGRTVRTDRARETFLEQLRETCNVSHSAREAGISRTVAYEWRASDPDFAAAWEDAEEQAVDKLEKVARDRAIDGSDRMMEILLKAHRPEKYVERFKGDFSGALTVKPDLSALTPDQLAALASIPLTGE
jgi:hypothetical protein